VLWFREAVLPTMRPLLAMVTVGYGLLAGPVGVLSVAAG